MGRPTVFGGVRYRSLGSTVIVTFVATGEAASVITVSSSLGAISGKSGVDIVGKNNAGSGTTWVVDILLLLLAELPEAEFAMLATM